MNYIGYLFIFLLELVLAFIFLLLLICEIYSIRRYFKNEKRKIDITNELLDLANRVNNTLGIDEYPVLSEYLSQAKDILMTKPYSFETLQVDLLKNISDDIMSESQKQNLSNEYSIASQSIQDLVNELSCILGYIYSIRHPLRYRYNTMASEIKKNISLQILRILHMLSLIYKKKNESLPKEEQAVADTLVCLI